MKTDKYFKQVMFDLFVNNEKKFENINPNKEQIYDAILAEVQKQPKQVVDQMLADLMNEVGDGDPHSEFERIGTELATEMAKKEQENVESKLESKNSQNGTGSSNP